MIQPQVYGIESRLEGISVIVLLYYLRGSLRRHVSKYNVYRNYRQNKF